MMGLVAASVITWAERQIPISKSADALFQTVERKENLDGPVHEQNRSLHHPEGEQRPA